MNPLFRCWVEVEGSALAHNIRFIRSRIAPTTRIMAIVKADAYGHGLLPLTRELIQLGIESFGVATVSEAAQLRDAGVQSPIHLMSAVLPSEYAQVVRQETIPLLSTLSEARLLARAATSARKIAQAHFKVDTGMGRMGLWGEEAVTALGAILKLKAVKISALVTHLACAEQTSGLSARQLAAFESFRLRFSSIPSHLANSAAFCLGMGAASANVRPGIALYGIAPVPSLQEKLRPLLQWKSRITLLRHLSKGRTVSYGATYQLPKKQLIATVAVGYSDGYPRSLSNKSKVLIGGKRCPVRGRVTMDQILVDVSSVPQCKVGDEVVLIGTQGRETITATEIAQLAGTIPYEILTGLSGRVPRVYLHWKTRE